MDIDIQSSGSTDAARALLSSMIPIPRRSMSKRARETRVLAHIRQLCALGLPSRMVIPHILQSLREVIGSDIVGFHWAGNDGTVVDVYADEPQLLRAASDYHRSGRSMEGHLSAYGVDFRTAMRRGYGWGNTADLAPAFERSIEFDALWRPFGLRHGVERTCAQAGRGRGALGMFRGRNSKPYNRHDEFLLTCISGHIAHALMAPDQPNSEFTQSGDTGLIIVNSRGKIMSFSMRGRQLLELASRGRLANTRRGDRLPDWLRVLACCRSSENHLPAFLWHATAWGRFSFRAYRLDPFSGSEVVAIHISHLEPTRLQIARGALRLGLTPRQSEICVLLAEGLSHAQIAARMNIKISTVVDHLRKAYSSCDVHDHASLVGRIRAEAQHSPTDASTLPR